MAPVDPNKKRKEFPKTGRAFAKKRATPASFRKKDEPSVQLRSKTEYARTKGRKKYVASEFKPGQHPNSDRTGQKNMCMTGSAQSIDIANIIDSPRGGRAKQKQKEPQRVSACAEMEVVDEEEILDIVDPEGTWRNAPEMTADATELASRILRTLSREKNKPNMLNDVLPRVSLPIVSCYASLTHCHAGSGAVKQSGSFLQYGEELHADPLVACALLLGQW